MSTLVYLRGEKVNTTTSYDELRDLYENRHRYSRDNRMPLTCIQKHAGQMYLRDLDGDLWAAHYPGEGSCRIRIGREAESPQHRHMKDYAADACDAYPVIPEYSTGNGTRVDLLVDAPFRFSVEAQFSHITARDAKARTTKSTNGGAPPLWLPYGAPPWLSVVPTIRHNDHEITWEQRPPKHTVPAIGLRRIVPAHCTVSGPFNHCPDKRSGFCGGWHPDYQLVTGWTLDDALVGTCEQAVVFHQDRKKQVRVVLADSMAVYEDLTGLTGEFAPGTRTPLLRPVKDDWPRECTAIRAVETFDYGDPCILLCGNELLAPLSIARGICERCWIDNGRGSTPVQLAFNFTRMS
jgi:hypothetical protein